MGVPPASWVRVGSERQISHVCSHMQSGEFKNCESIKGVAEWRKKGVDSLDRTKMHHEHG